MDFKLVSPYQAKGDQPEAIRQLVEGLGQMIEHQTLLGVTGSGKTFTIANVIERVNRPTLVLSHNKTLAAQLYGEFKHFFPENSVEYFVSYYDYYQPEAYLPVTNTYIEKDLQINDEIEKLRLSATSALLSGRRDIIVIASVSCIYGIGNPTEFKNSIIEIKVGDVFTRNTFLHRLVENLYVRAGDEFKRGNFRVIGDTIDIYLAYADHALRIGFFDDEIESISSVNPEDNRTIETFETIQIFAANLFVSSPENTQQAIHQIQDDLIEEVENFKLAGKIEEAKRLEDRVNYDLEMIRELGYCSGI
jgi:excinuclease ABC subunit B